MLIPFSCANLEVSHWGPPLNVSFCRQLMVGEILKLVCVILVVFDKFVVWSCHCSCDLLLLASCELDVYSSPVVEVARHHSCFPDGTKTSRALMHWAKMPGIPVIQSYILYTGHVTMGMIAPGPQDHQNVVVDEFRSPRTCRQPSPRRRWAPCEGLWGR